MNYQSNRTDANKKLFLKTYTETRYNISETCRITGLDRSNYYEWLDKDPEFKKAINQKEEDLLDWIEEQAKKRMEQGSDKMIEFYLKNKGKKRGFGEQQININHLLKLDTEDEAGDTDNED